MGETLLPYALQALGKGLHIFPVEPGAKTPIRIYQDRPKDDAPWTIKWSEVASNDVNKVVQWWTYAPMANIGVACKPSGVFVVDCDQPKADGLLKGTPWEYLHELFGSRVDGETLWDQVAERYGGADGVTAAFDTYQVATGSGGRHFYFRWPESVHSSQDSIVKGLLDVRGNGGERGGYVLGAGSVTSNGRYAADGPAGVEGVPIADAPDWLVALCRYREPPRPPAVPRVFDRPRVLAFHGLIETVRSAPDGNLNNALFWASRAACNDGLSEDECSNLLVPEYVQLGGTGGERQAFATIRSAYRNQQRKMG